MESGMANRDLVAIGTSAGGVEALLYLVKRLPNEFPASVLVTIHMPGRARSSLDEVLTRAGAAAGAVRARRGRRQERMHLSRAARSPLAVG